MSDQIKDRFGNVVPEYYTGYFNAAGKRDLIELLSENLRNTSEFIRKITNARENFAYAPEKWTVKEVLIHMLDVERIFTGRALRFARNDATMLPGFDENMYPPFTEAASRSINSIAEEYEALRRSTIELYANFSEVMRQRSGSANGVKISVETLGYVIAGHEIHHIDILKARYGL